MTVKAITAGASSDDDGVPLNIDAAGHTGLAIVTGVTLQTNGTSSDAIYATGAYNTILVGGTIETTGTDSRGIYFDDATGSVQKVHVTDTGLVTASPFSGSGARIAVSAGQRLEVLNEGEISGFTAIVGAEFSDLVKVTASGIVGGTVSLGGGDDIIDFAGAWKEALADLGDGDDLVRNAGSSIDASSTQTFSLGAGNDTGESGSPRPRP